MASLNHVSIRDKEYGWVHITPEDASRLFPNETVSSSDHVFICELCGQYVAFTREGKKTRYFCHSRGEEIKDCDERAEQYNHYPTIQYDGQFDFPLKLLLESETFSLSIGIPQGAFQENDFSVSIKGTASHFFNMKERKQETGITWLPLQQDISIQYHIETHDKVLLNWPDHIPGINPMGTMFDSRGNKILHAEDEVTVGNNYYLITDRCICESFPDVNIVELMHCSIVNSVWRVYEVQAVSFSPDSARFFILYKLHLVKKPTDLHIIWPMTVEEGSISYHNADNLYIAYNGEDQISLQLMPCSAQSAQKEMSGYFQVQSNEPYFYENRNFLIDKTGKVHTKGDLAVFAWSDSPNASGSDKPFNDATELKDFPIHVFKLSAKNTLQVIDNLRNGVSCGSASHNVMYIFCESDEGFQGVLCPAQSMEERNQQYFLKDSVSKLPYYLLKSSDILSIYELKNLFGNEKCVFLKALVPGTPISYLPTRETSAIVKDVILKNRFLTWNSFRNFTSNAEGSHKYTQKELRVFKECLAQVQCKTVQEELAAELGCTVSEATTYIENFIENANSYLEGDEVDTQLLSRLVMANDELREKYTALVEEKWKTDAAEKINIAAQKVEELEAQCKEKANTLKSLNSDIEDRRDKLQELQNEVAQNKILARESYSMVQEKIATAKHDVSSFLADMACYFPNSTVIANSSASTSGDYVNAIRLLFLSV